jgi:hypothetical protein
MAAALMRLKILSAHAYQFVQDRCYPVDAGRQRHPVPPLPGSCQK